MDTPSTQQDTTETQVEESVTTQQDTAVSTAPTFSWKNQLTPDFANSPTMNKYPDTKEGFNDAVRAHLDLQRMLGNEKVPIPKGPNDTVAMDLFKKAMRIPDKPEGYGLPDAELPDSMKAIDLKKDRFSEIVHKHNLTPDQAKGLWQTYVELSKSDYMTALKQMEDQMSSVSQQMRMEWGDAFQTKVDLGQMVINKFSESQEMNDFVTAQLVKDPRGIKFLAKIGDQFAENKVGDFKYQRHSLTPEEAQREIDSVRRDSNHPYNNEKAPQAERDRAIEYVNSLYSVIGKTKTR